MADMDVPHRPPSMSWEPIPLGDRPELCAWVWYYPVTAPASVLFQTPASHWQPGRQAPSLRQLLTAAGIDGRSVTSWIAQGAAFNGLQGGNPLLDQPLPPPRPGIDPTITVYLAIVPLPPPVSLPSSPFPAAPPRSDAGPESIYAAIDSDWNAIRLLEAQLAGLRKQLNSLFGRLQALNRDLNADERLAADNQDNREWQDARRWLRDSAGLASRILRAYDIGVTSSAGNRNRFDDLYEQFIRPRRATDGLAAIQQQFESHRKTVQSLQTEMQTALTNASRDGEIRAQQVLSRIAAKARQRRSKR